MKRLPTLPPRAFDAGVALFAGIIGGASGLGRGDPGVPAAAVGVFAVMGLILYPRRRIPGTVLALEAIGVLAIIATGAKLDPSFPAVLISAYSAAVYGNRRLMVTAGVVGVALLAGIGIASASHPGSWPRVHAAGPTVIAAVGSWLVGLVIRKQFAARNAHAAERAERADLMEQRASNAILAERLRIARELHDIVAHHLSVVVIQAQGAQRMAGRDVMRTRAAMAEVERTGRTALDEMRRLLGLLRTGEAEVAASQAGAYVPALGLADVDDLAERMRGAGLPVTIVRDGEPGEVPEDVSLTIYRIIQESLTNVLKHAGPASATVRLCFGRDLEVTITDDGRGAAAALDKPAAPGAGRGTLGMTERVAAFGGRLSVGPQPGGGYRVHARIPQ
jgi:signal transduction histidine kinase